MCLSLCSPKPEPSLAEVREWQALVAANGGPSDADGGAGAEGAVGHRMASDEHSAGGSKLGRHRYPYALVWTPLPLITWLLPFIGHVGICSAQGVIYDFQGPYTIGTEGRMAFGNPTRYLPLNRSRRITSKQWNDSVAYASACYARRMHDLCLDNCHSHAARALCDMAYAGFRSWNMIILCFWIFFAGRYVSAGAFVSSWLPSLIIYGLVIGAIYAF